jgi:hypothetical protein
MGWIPPRSGVVTRSIVKRTPIIDHDAAEPAVFEPGNLLEGARRQKVVPVYGRA